MADEEVDPTSLTEVQRAQEEKFNEDREGKPAEGANVPGDSNVPHEEEAPAEAAPAEEPALDLASEEEEGDGGNSDEE